MKIRLFLISTLGLGILSASAMDNQDIPEWIKQDPSWKEVIELSNQSQSSSVGISGPTEGISIKNSSINEHEAVLDTGTDPEKPVDLLKNLKILRVPFNTPKKLEINGLHLENTIVKDDKIIQGTITKGTLFYQEQYYGVGSIFKNGECILSVEGTKN